MIDKYAEVIIGGALHRKEIEIVKTSKKGSVMLYRETKTGKLYLLRPGRLSEKKHLDVENIVVVIPVFL